MAQMGAKEHTHTGNKSDIPERHQQKKVIRQDRHGKYEINQVFYDEYRRLTTT